MKDTTKFIVNGIKNTCTKYKNRTAGSKAERDCQKEFERTLRQTTTNVRYEKFKLNPRAFMGWMPYIYLVMILSVGLHFIALFTGSVPIAFVSAGIVISCAVIWVLEFVLYRKFIDFLFPECESANVYANLPPKSDVKRRIVFCAHADAAYELTYVREANGKLLYPLALTSVIGLFYVIAVNVALSINLASNLHMSPVFGYIACAFVPVFLAMTRFVNLGLVVDGANDNLSGCYVAMAVLKELKARGMEFQHTEVACLITGGEEAGIRGSLEFARKHKDEMNEVETVFIAMDTLSEVDKLAVYSRGQNWTQKNCARVASLIKSAGSHIGLNIKDGGFFTGATDAEGFSRYGLRSCGLCGVDHNPRPYYHTRHDTHDNIDTECIEASLELCIKTAELFDKGNL